MDVQPDGIATENALALVDSDVVVMRPALLATAYFLDAQAPAARSGALSCLDIYNNACAEYLRWIADPRSKRLLAYDNARFADLKQAIEASDPDTAWSAIMQGGASPKEASNFGVIALGPPRWEPVQIGVMQFRFPLTWFTDHPGSLQLFFREICSRLRADQGYAGVGLVESASRPIAVRHQPQVYQIATRFPGLEIDDPLSHVNYLRFGTKSGTWLTALGQRWIGKLGGIAEVRQALSSVGTVFEYDGGIVIQAGPKPRMGDADTHRIPSEYRMMARLLRPIRVTEHRKFHESGPGERFDHDRTMDWFARLD